VSNKFMNVKRRKERCHRSGLEPKAKGDTRGKTGTVKKEREKRKRPHILAKKERGMASSLTQTQRGGKNKPFLVAVKGRKKASVQSLRGITEQGDHLVLQTRRNREEEINMSSNLPGENVNNERCYKISRQEGVSLRG